LEGSEPPLLGLPRPDCLFAPEPETSEEDVGRPEFADVSMDHG
jgi:hypothetical protein